MLIPIRPEVHLRRRISNEDATTSAVFDLSCVRPSSVADGNCSSGRKSRRPAAPRFVSIVVRKLSGPLLRASDRFPPIPAICQRAAFSSSGAISGACSIDGRKRGAGSSPRACS